MLCTGRWAVTGEGTVRARPGPRLHPPPQPGHARPLRSVLCCSHVSGARRPCCRSLERATRVSAGADSGPCRRAALLCGNSLPFGACAASSCARWAPTGPLPARTGACVAGEPWLGLCRAPGTHFTAGLPPPSAAPPGQAWHPSPAPLCCGSLQPQPLRAAGTGVGRKPVECP